MKVDCDTDVRVEVICTCECCGHSEEFLDYDATTIEEARDKVEFLICSRCGELDDE